MKTLIISGAPNFTGQTAFLEEVFLRYARGDITLIRAFDAKISPCIDCKYCSNVFGCAIKDDMGTIYDGMDDFDNVMVFSPVYFATLPGPVLNVLSRFQIMFAARHIRGDKISLKPKRGGVILSMGGFDPVKYGAQGALEASKTLLNILNARLVDTVVACNTDAVPVQEDQEIQSRVADLAAKIF